MSFRIIQAIVLWRTKKVKKMEAIIVVIVVLIFVLFFFWDKKISNEKTPEEKEWESYEKKKKEKYEEEKASSVFSERERTIGEKGFKYIMFKSNGLKEFISPQEGEKIFFFREELEPFVPWEQAEVECPFCEWTIYKTEKSLVVEVLHDRGYAGRVVSLSRIPVESLEEAKEVIMDFTDSPPKQLVEKINKL